MVLEAAALRDAGGVARCGSRYRARARPASDGLAHHQRSLFRGLGRRTLGGSTIRRHRGRDRDWRCSHRSTGSFGGRPIASQPRWRRSVRSARSRGRALALASGGLLVAGASLAVLPSRSLLVGFAAMLLPAIERFLRPPYCVARSFASAFAAERLGATWRLALTGAASSLSRTGIAVAALSVADQRDHRHRPSWCRASRLASRHGPRERCERISTSRRRGRICAPERSIDPDVVARLLAVPGILEHSAGRRVSVDSVQGPVLLDVLQPATHSFRGITLVAGQPQDVWRAFGTGALLVSSPSHTAIRSP